MRDGDTIGIMGEVGKNLKRDVQMSNIQAHRSLAGAFRIRGYTRAQNRSGDVS